MVDCGTWTQVPHSLADTWDRIEKDEDGPLAADAAALAEYWKAPEGGGMNSHRCCGESASCDPVISAILLASASYRGVPEYLVTKNDLRM